MAHFLRDKGRAIDEAAVSSTTTTRTEASSNSTKPLHEMSMSATTVAGSLSVQQAPRSNPISIVRNRETTAGAEDSDDDDVNRTQLHVYSQSFPTNRLLRAPLLSSQPNRNLNTPLHFPNMLPPTIKMTDPLAESGKSDVVAYGSLRESQSLGRFLDGPRSFRNKETGLVQRMENSRRFRTVAPASLPNAAATSIGERIQHSIVPPQQQQQQSSHRNRQERNSSTSSLTALLNADPPPVVQERTTGALAAAGTATRTLYDTNQDDNQVNMLSMSLTALEILQQGRLRSAPLPFQQVALPTSIVVSDQDDHSSDEPTYANMPSMTRSISEPMGRKPATETSASMLLPPVADPIEHHPDTDCVFDMEME